MAVLRCNRPSPALKGSIRKMFDQMGDEKIKSSALALIETEDDEKYRNKYLGVWKDVLEQTKKPT